MNLSSVSILNFVNFISALLVIPSFLTQRTPLVKNKRFSGSFVCFDKNLPRLLLG